MTDTIQNVIIKGNYAEYWRKRGYSLVSDRPVAIMGDSKDTLYIHADTLKATFDTVRNETRELFGYHNARFYRTDIQGISDSLHYSFADSLISLYYKPTLWSGENQLTADTILIQTGKNSIRKIYMQNAAFIASKDTIANFNQIKGKNMIGYFADNELVSIDVNGNSETIYYVREEDKALIGINKAAGSRMRLYIKDSKIKRIVYFDKPTGNMFPDKDMKSDERLLKGFSWRGEARPINKEDIFRKSGVSEVPTPEQVTE
jgi:hypothetical protein